MQDTSESLGVSGERLVNVAKELNQIEVEDTQMSLVDEQGNPVVVDPTPPVEEEVIIETAEEVLPEEAKLLPEMTCGYLVGVKPEGEFVFEALGTEPGLVQLLGLHKYAEHRLEVAKDINQGYGTPLLNNQLAQIQQILKVMLNMLTQQSKDSLASQIK